MNSNLKIANYLFSNTYNYIFSKFLNPIYVGWDYTYKCNHTCDYCGRWKINKKELSYNDKKLVVDKICEMKPLILSFNGGECIIDSNFNKIIGYASKKLLVNINTNGSYFDLYKKFKTNDFPHSITLSIDAIGENKLTAENYYEYSNGLIKKILLYQKHANSVIKIRVNIHKGNLLNIGNSLNYWTKYIDQILLQPLHSCKNNYFSVPEDLKFNDISENLISNEINKILKNPKVAYKGYHKQISNYINGTMGNIKCFSGLLFYQIDPYGDIYNCNEYKHKFGNLLNSEFSISKNILKNRNIKAISKDCKCWYNCSGIINHYVRGIDVVGIKR